MKRTARWKHWIALAVILQFPTTAPVGAVDRDALWKKVNGACVPNQQEHSDPTPCDTVNISEGLDRGFAILKNNNPAKPYDYLLIPTRRIAGVEDESLSQPEAPNYFRAAWDARIYVSKRLAFPLSWDMVALAVNSSKDRSQDQLHIHIDCVRTEVRDFLHNAEETFDERWSQVKLPAANHPYFITKIARDSLDGINPYQLVAKRLPDASGQMGLETLVLIGAQFKDGNRGFYLLSSHHDGVGSAHGEDLLDPACELAKSSN